MIELYEGIGYERGFSEHTTYGDTLEGIVDGYGTRQFMDSSFRPKRHKHLGGYGIKPPSKEEAKKILENLRKRKKEVR